MNQGHPMKLPPENVNSTHIRYRIVAREEDGEWKYEGWVSVDGGPERRFEP